MEVTSQVRQRISENMDREELAMWFTALDGIRASGEVNMGASAGILRNSGLDRRVAQAVAQAWMATFSHVDAIEDRVEEAYCDVHALLKHGEGTDAFA